MRETESLWETVPSTALDLDWDWQPSDEDREWAAQQDWENLITS